MLFDYAKAAPGQTVLIHGGRWERWRVRGATGAQAGLLWSGPLLAEDEPYVRSLAQPA